MPVLELETPTPVASYSVHGMNIHDAPGHHGVTRMVLPENTLVLKSHAMIANLRWQGSFLSKREWAAGETAFVPAGSEMVSRMDDPYRGTLVRLDPDMIQIAAMDVDIRMSDLDFAAIASPQMVQITSSLISLASVGVLEGHPTVAEALATALVIETTKALSPSAERTLSTLKNGISIDRKRRVVEFVDANLHRQITLAELASVASLSLFHFSRSFKQATGMSPAVFLLRRRVARAKELLRSTSSIAQVALECGFSSQSHLTDAFKRVTGLTPAAFRARLK